jgi:long-subunit acyl-CoA synthetase (AMP-forming)
MVPAILHGLLKSGLAEQLGQAKYLTYVMIGAAPLGPLLQEKGAKALGVRLVQGYGELEGKTQKC